MNYTQLYKEAKRRERGSPLIYDKSTLIILDKSCLFRRLRAFEWHGWTLEELKDGQWQSYYEERGALSNKTLYSSEEEACDAFLRIMNGNF